MIARECTRRVSRFAERSYDGQQDIYASKKWTVLESLVERAGRREQNFANLCAKSHLVAVKRE